MFQVTSGIVNAAADHYTHVVGNGYDWHVNGTIDYSLKGRYSGNLVRDDAVAFIRGQAAQGPAEKPFFMYVPFQECHSPFQVDKNYPDLYPTLGTQGAALAGMVTHTDEMIGDIVDALNATKLLPNTFIIWMGDNGGPHVDHDPAPSQWDSTTIERNYPYRGQKHEIFEGGVHVAGFVYSELLPKQVHTDPCC